MDEVLLKRVVGLVTLVVVAFLLSWLLPRPGLDDLERDKRKVVSIDLTESDAERRAAEKASRERDASEVFAEHQDEVAQAKTQDASMPVAPDPVEKPKPEDIPPQVIAPPSEPAVTVSVKPEATPQPTKKPESVAAPPKPVVKPEPAAKPLPKPELPKAVAGEKFVVQAGAFSQINSAREMLARVSLQGLDCVISPADAAAGTIYRVRCGPYQGRSAADAASQTLGRGNIASQVISDG